MLTPLLVTTKQHPARVDIELGGVVVHRGSEFASKASSKNLMRMQSLKWKTSG